MRLLVGINFALWIILLYFHDTIVSPLTFITFREYAFVVPFVIFVREKELDCGLKISG